MAKKLWLSGKYKDKYAIVDDEDYETLSVYKWQYTSNGYAKRKYGKTSLLMHRVIAKTPKGLVTDHLNHNKLDNRKSNLRVCTQMDNMQNKLHIGRLSKGGVKRRRVSGRIVYYGEYQKHYVRYLTVMFENEEQAKGALKQMIKDKKL